MLIGTAVLSIVSAFMSRHLVLAPLCCFAGIMAADLLVAVVISVAYAQFDDCFPLAVVFSLPSLIIVLVLRRTDLSRFKLFATS